MEPNVPATFLESDVHPIFLTALPALHEIAMLMCGSPQNAKLALFELFDGQVYPEIIADLKADRVAEARQYTRTFADMLMGSHPLYRSVILATIHLRAMQLHYAGNEEGSQRLWDSWPYATYVSQIPAEFAAVIPVTYDALVTVFLIWATAEADHGRKLRLEMIKNGQLPADSPTDL